MTTKVKEKDIIEEVNEEVKIDSTPKKEVKSTPISQEKDTHFMPIVKVESDRIDPLAVFNLNPLYEARWCNANKMANGASGIWKSVDKRHEDFKDLRVMVDQTPTESFIRFEDLILCVTRKETIDNIRRINREKIQKRDAQFKSEFAENINRLNKADSKAELLSVLGKLD